MQQDSFGYRGVARPGAAAIRTGESEWRLRTLITLDGLAWLFATALGIPNPRFGSLAWATYEGVPLFILAFFAEGEAGVAASSDGSSWSESDEALDIETGDGGEVQASVTGPDSADVYSSGSQSVHRMVATRGSDGSVTVRFVDVEIAGELTSTDLGIQVAKGSENLGSPKADPELEAKFIGDLLHPPVPSGP